MTPPLGKGVGTVADLAAIEAAPLSSRNLPTSTFAALARAAERWPDKPALHYFARADTFSAPQTLSYAEFLSEISRTANLLRARGIGREDVVAYLLPNLPETHMVIWGGETAGIVLAVNPALGVDDIASILTEAGAKILVTQSATDSVEIWQKAAEAAPQVPSLELILCVGAVLAGAKVGRIPVADFETTRSAMPDRLTFGPPNAENLSSYFCTGGTTGRPKIARRRHGAEVFDAWSVAAHCPELFKTEAVGFCGLPLFHVNAQLVTGLAAWMQGGTIVLGTPAGYRDRSVIAQCWKIFERYGVTFFSGVPTIYSALLSVPQSGQDLSSLSFGICGAAPMPVELFRRFQDETGVRILEGYGLTEGCCVSSINPASGERRIGSIGLRLPYQNMRTAALDEEGVFNDWCDPEEVGTVLLNGPNVFEGYCDPAHTRSAWIEVEGQRWFNTGDLARQDADGYFWLTGRKKDLIIRGGHNIDPAVIEAAAHAHPSVALAAAIGRPDAHAGEVPVLAVQLVSGHKIDSETLLAEISESIGERAARPKALRVVEAIPLTAVGKIFKPGLVIQEIEDVVQKEAASVGSSISEILVEQDRLGRLNATIYVDHEGCDLLASALSRFNFGYRVRSR